MCPAETRKFDYNPHIQNYIQHQILKFLKHHQNLGHLINKHRLKYLFYHDGKKFKKVLLVAYHLIS